MGKNGSVSVIFVALLAIMMILVMAESRALFHLFQIAQQVGLSLARAAA